MTRTEILQAARICVCGQREQEYGSPEDNFRRIAKLWNAYLGDTITDAQDVAIMMALLKIARISAGGTEDSFVDLAGYAACAGELFSRKEARAYKTNATFEPIGLDTTMKQGEKK